jgi:NDP-4-keto-2,6-dideoxyhexose 3-C-methyltransferase
MLPLDTPSASSIPIARHTICRSCGGDLIPTLSLGVIHLQDFPRSAGTLLHPGIPPMVLKRCASHACGLVQLGHTIPPDWMFKTYWYRSGVNETMVAELRNVVESAQQHVVLEKHDTVIDIGANDGTLLQQYPPHLRLLTMAWEPAANLFEVLRPHVQILIPHYFSATRDEWTHAAAKAKVITACAMFYDLEDPHKFLEGITHALHPEGVFVIQQAYLPAMLRTTGFDNICHEHLAYHDLRSMEALLAPHGLEVIDVEYRAINGGSFRTWIKFAGKGTPTPSVEGTRKSEAVFFADRPGVFEIFSGKVRRVKEQLQGVLERYLQAGKVVDLLGASTKGNTLVQYVGLDARNIRQAWERSPEKWGRYYGSTAIPIVCEAEGRKDPPAALLGIVWQFRDALIAREGEYLSKGGKMIFPLPYVETVEYRK